MWGVGAGGKVCGKEVPGELCVELRIRWAGWSESGLVSSKRLEGLSGGWPGGVRPSVGGVGKGGGLWMSGMRGRIGNFV